MIIGFNTHDLSGNLASHLMRVGKSEIVSVKTHGLIALSAKSALQELQLLSLGCRTTKPGVHAWMSPPNHYNQQQWANAWQLFEAEARLEGQPFLEVQHAKLGFGGRTADHVHRVYLRLKIDGVAIVMNHCAPRAEKLSRILEFENGERLIVGRFNRAVEAALRKEGRTDVANAILASGLLNQSRPEATSPGERAQSERLQDFAADEIKRRAYLAFTSAKTADHFRRCLQSSGLFLCRGDGGKAMILTERGSAYRLAAAVSSGAKVCKAKGSVKAADVHALAEQLKLQPIAAIRGALQREPRLPNWQQITGADRSIPLNYLDDEKGNSEKGKLQILSPSIDQSLDNKFAQANIDFAQELYVPDAKPKPAPLSPEAVKAFDRFLNLLLHPKEPDTITLDLLPASEPAVTKMQEQNSKPPAKQYLTLAGQNWRTDYKASLAEVGHEFGPLIKWVENNDSVPKRITLHDESFLLASPAQIVASKPTNAAMELMISFALRQNWTEVRLSGFNDVNQRKEFARLCARRGLFLANKDLKDIIGEELDLISQDLIDLGQAQTRNSEPIEVNRLKSKI